ncbi:Trp biosynthesis-associated membrane protein [Sanguibacter sp. Z1732]|uniref:Trp biosynthesis-associated membrane protein n=1 Tax=Sanguibacter sp. Z1732 TaxID=3435412 RepID=UPI003D9C92C1
MLLGAGAFGLSLLTWVGAEAVTTLGPQPVRVSGAGAAPVVPSAALVVVVAGLAVGLSGPVVRILAPAAAALAAVVALIAGLVLIADPDPAARSAAGEVGGVREITGAAELTVWPWVVVVLLASTVLVALVLPFRAGTWAPAAARYERAVVRPEGAGPAGTRASGAATDRPLPGRTGMRSVVAWIPARPTTMRTAGIAGTTSPASGALGAMPPVGSDRLCPATFQEDLHPCRTRPSTRRCHRPNRRRTPRTPTTVGHRRVGR